MANEDNLSAQDDHFVIAHPEDVQLSGSPPPKRNDDNEPPKEKKSGPTPLLKAILAFCGLLIVVILGVVILAVGGDPEPEEQAQNTETPGTEQNEPQPLSSDLPLFPIDDDIYDTFISDFLSARQDEQWDTIPEMLESTYRYLNDPDLSNQEALAITAQSFRLIMVSPDESITELSETVNGFDQIRTHAYLMRYTAEDGSEADEVIIVNEYSDSFDFSRREYKVSQVHHKDELTQIIYDADETAYSVVQQLTRGDEFRGVRRVAVAMADPRSGGCGGDAPTPLPCNILTSTSAKSFDGWRVIAEDNGPFNEDSYYELSDDGLSVVFTRILDDAGLLSGSAVLTDVDSGIASTPVSYSYDSQARVKDMPELIQDRCDNAYGDELDAEGGQVGISKDGNEIEVYRCMEKEPSGPGSDDELTLPRRSLVTMLQSGDIIYSDTISPSLDVFEVLLLNNIDSDLLTFSYIDIAFSVDLEEGKVETEQLEIDDISN